MFDLGNGQWKIPRLTELLLEIIPLHKHFFNFKVTHELPRIGSKTILLNAKLLVQNTLNQELIFMFIQEVTSQIAFLCLSI